MSSINCGGWAAIITKNGEIEKTLYRGYRNTTNNRCEIYGVLAILQYFKEPTDIKIYSDSQYVVNTINNKWAVKWIQDNDETKKNLDLWKQVVRLLYLHNVECVWVKGHANNKLNNKCDLLCVHAAQCLDLPEDNGYIND